MIKKLMSIGSNCIGADWSNSLGLRVPGPIDNISGVNIYKSPYLFSGDLEYIFFKKQYSVRPSTQTEIEKFHYEPNVFSFMTDISIVHNNYESKNFQSSLKKRFKNFYRYYKESLKNDELWYIYSLNNDDENFSKEQLYKFKHMLPKSCSERLICLGIRGKNSNFKDVFINYIELESESQYRWHNKNFANELLKDMEDEYNLKFGIDL